MKDESLENNVVSLHTRGWSERRLAAGESGGYFFLNGRSFRNKADLKEQLQKWLSGCKNQRIHRTTGQKPIEIILTFITGSISSP